MPRPKSPNPKKHKIEVRFTGKEKKKLKSLAEKAEMTVSDYIRDKIGIENLKDQ